MYRMRFHEAACCLLLSLAPAMAQVWKGDVPDAAKVAALQKAAAKGNPAAMADVAYLSRYCRGGVKFDPQRIFDYSRRAAKAGNAFGMSGLAYCYMQGCGVDADGQEAYRWAKKAANLKHPCGIYRLGVCHDQGHGISIDRKRMVELYRQAADMGSVNARLGLTIAYLKGLGVKPDPDEAFAMADALVREHDWFFGALAIVVDIGKEAAEKSAYERAVACMTRHAALGLPHAIRGLAHYQRENGLLDDEGFLHQIIEAARMGDSVAYENLSAYVDHREHSGYDLPVYSEAGTFYDLCILPIARGLNIGIRMGAARRAISAYANGGSVCPRDLEAARAIAQSWVLADPALTKGLEGFHMEMAYLYQMGLQHQVKGFERADLAVAHAVYDCATSSNCMRWLQWFNRGYFPGFQRDIAKAYVTAKLAHDMKDSYTTRENIVKRIEVQLKEADWKEIKRLQDEGYPTAPNFREEAKKTILASGFKLPEQKPESDPVEEDLKQ